MPDDPPSPRRGRATAPDPEYAWMAIIVGALVILGGVGLTTLSLSDGDGRAALWIALGSVGLVGVGFGISSLVRAARFRSPD